MQGSQSDQRPVFRIESLDEARKVIEIKKRSIDPVYFTEAVLGDQMWDIQKEVARAVRDNRVVTVRSCHGIGKTFMGSRIALWFLDFYKDSIVVTTAPTWRQVEEQMWRYMRNAHKKAKIPLRGKRLKRPPTLEYDEEWYAIGVSSEDTDKIQGFHPKSGHILVLVDEAAGVPESTYVAAEAIMTSIGARMLLLGNPTSISGSFYYSHHTDPTSYKVAISCFNTPNFVNNGIETVQDLIDMDESKIEISHPYLITPQWAKDKITRWGVETPMFQSRVLGQFPTAEANTLIPLNMVEAATSDERLEFLQKRGDHLQPQKLGVDVARYGDDKTVYTPRHGGITDPQQVYGKEGIDVTVQRVKMFGAFDFAGVDEDGVGGGVVDILIADKIDNVHGIRNGSSAVKDDTGLTFANMRSQLWWNLSELFKKGEIYIPPHETELMAELSSVRYFITRQGISVETKEEIKKRLHKSPDRADSLMYSFADFVVQGGGSSLMPATGRAYNSMYNKKQR